MSKANNLEDLNNRIDALESKLAQVEKRIEVTTSPRRKFILEEEADAITYWIDEYSMQYNSLEMGLRLAVPAPSPRT